MIDSHCHLDHEPLFSNLDKVLSRSKNVGIEKILTINQTIKKAKIISWASHLITIILIFLIGLVENLGLIYWIGCTILFGLFIKEHFLILKIDKNNINKAFFNMNAQISIVLLMMFALSTLI